MPKAMDAAAWTARAEAYSEAAEHLKLSWTEDPREYDQGKIVSAKLYAESDKCRRIAATCS